MSRVPKVHEDGIFILVKGGDHFVLQAGKPAFDVWESVK